MVQRLLSRSYDSGNTHAAPNYEATDITCELDNAANADGLYCLDDTWFALREV